MKMWYRLCLTLRSVQYFGSTLTAGARTSPKSSPVTLTFRKAIFSLETFESGFMAALMSASPSISPAHPDPIFPGESSFDSPYRIRPAKNTFLEMSMRSYVAKQRPTSGFRAIVLLCLYPGFGFGFPGSQSVCHAHLGAYAAALTDVYSSQRLSTNRFIIG